MKKILVITGHPSKDGFSFFISNNYIKGAKEERAEVKHISLPDLKFNPILKNYKDILEKDLLKSQKLISWADHIVFIYPTWWGAMPALMKGFIDRVFIPHFAYKYSENGKIIRLLKGKTARIITTSGSSKLYVLANHVLLTGSLKYPVLKFCGFSRVYTNVFHTVRSSLSEERKKKIAKKSECLGKKDASKRFFFKGCLYFHERF